MDVVAQIPTSDKREIVFLIDCRKSMFDCYDEKTPFRIALQCAKARIADAACSGQRDLTAIVFLGTGKTENPDDLKNVYIIQKLEKPSADQVLFIERELLTMGHSQFESKYGQSADFFLGDAFWVCRRLFTKSKRGSMKQVFLFTNDDNPHRNVNSLMQNIGERIKDLEELGVHVAVMPVAFGDFDAAKCYSQILPNFDVDEANRQLEQLMNRSRAKQKPTRRKRTVPFTISGSFKVAVSMFNLVQEAREPVRSQKPVERRKADDESDVSSESSSESEPEMDIDEPSAAGTSDGSSDVIPKEKPSLKLIGFKSRCSLKVYEHKQTPSFIVPNDEVVKGSSTFLIALVEQCLRKDKVAICRLVSQRSGKVSLCALIPEMETRGDKYLVGFHLQALPFREDVREPELVGSEPVTLPDGVVQGAMEIVQQCTKTFEPNAFRNVRLQKFYSFLEAKALHMTNPEVIPIDQSLPSLEYYENKKHIFKTLDNCLPAPLMQVETSLSSISLEDDAKQGELGRHTVKLLKDFCKSRNIVCGSRKAEMIEAIQKFYA